MNFLKYKKQLVTALHLLFWIISFNLFNSFFSRGVESGYIMDGIDLTMWNVLIINNIIIVLLIIPFIWLIKGIRRWVKVLHSLIPLFLIIWGIYLMFHPKEDNLLVPLILGYFADNFLYVMIFHLTIIAAVYININILIKRYLSQGKFGIYLICAACLAVVSGAANYAIFDLCIDLIFPKLFFISWFRIWELILIVTLYMAITTIVYLFWQYWLLLIENREKTHNELSALKAQINPHFLFNNLNTIYGLAVKGDERTKDVILQLSDFLRYVLYDTSSEKILLEKEIEIIKTYVDLQRERINQDTTSINLTVEGDFGGALIAPLLLLPMTENCFKHGIGNNPGTIQIDVSYADHQLHFAARNPIAQRENPVSNGQGGIGLKNVEKRLNLLYADKHQLAVTEEKDYFTVDLKILLDQ